MAGAGVRWPLSQERTNPSFLGVELLAGTGSDESVHMVSTARANLSFGVGSRMRLGVSVGALYVGLEPTEGPLKNIDRFTTLVGIQTGFVSRLGLLQKLLSRTAMIPTRSGRWWASGDWRPVDPGVGRRPREVTAFRHAIRHPS